MGLIPSDCKNCQSKIDRLWGGSPGLVVMRDDSCSRGRGFESRCHILDGLSIKIDRHQIKKKIEAFFRTDGTNEINEISWMLPYLDYRPRIIYGSQVNCNDRMDSKMLKQHLPIVSVVAQTLPWRWRHGLGNSTSFSRAEVFHNLQLIHYIHYYNFLEKIRLRSKKIEQNHLRDMVGGNNKKANLFILFTHFLYIFLNRRSASQRG